MALLATFSSHPKSRSEQALRQIKAIEDAIKKVGGDADAETVIEAVVGVLRKSFGEKIEERPAKAKAKSKKE